MPKTTPIQVTALAALAEKHGWNVYSEGNGEDHTFSASRWIEATNCEFMFVVEWEVPLGKDRWRCKSRVGLVQHSIMSEDGSIEGVEDGPSHHWKAVSHIKHWLARPDEVVAWDWVRAEAS